MKALLRGLLGMMIVALGGCAVDQPPTVLQPVGPVPTVRQNHRSGTLVVYTAIEEPKIHPDTLFYPHTAYAIYDSHGAFLRGVRNHVGAWDESPFRVSLPPGRYTVRAESEIDGDVAVPVIIKGAKTTVVNLQRNGHTTAGL